MAVLTRGHLSMDLVFVVDTKNHRIQSFLCDGTAVKQWGSKGQADGQFNYPSGMAVLARSQDRILARSQDRILARSQDQGHPTQYWIIVADFGNHRIQVFDVDGAFICKWGQRGQDDGQFKFPHGISVLARSQDGGHPTQDLVYVTDMENHRVQVFGLDGTFIRKWRTTAGITRFDEPIGIAVHPTRDLIFVSEHHRIRAFRGDGTFLFSWDVESFAGGPFPKPLALHPLRDLLFVSDCGQHRMQIFNLDGSLVCTWGSQGETTFPAGVSIHPTTDVAYVSDAYRIQAFSLFQTSRKRKRIAD